MEPTLEQCNRDYQEYKSGRELAEHLGNFVNKMGRHSKVKGFIEGMFSQHRTLQQSVFELFLKWVYKMADTEYYDARNEYTVKYCKKIKEALGEYGDNCPFI